MDEQHSYTQNDSFQSQWHPSFQKKLPLGTVQLTWKCICQDTRTAVAPQLFARRLVEISEREINEQTLPLSPTSTSTAPTTLGSFPASAASSTLQSISLPRSFDPLRDIESPEVVYNYPGIHIASPPAIPVSMACRYILFMVNTAGLRLRAIESQFLSNDQLFDRMRFEYRQSKGWLRTWFGLSVFSYCDFYKFESWARERYCERGGGIPPISEAGYFYMPRPMDNEPPISKHEFYDRFYQRVPPEGCTAGHGGLYSDHDAVDRIPQKKGTEIIPTNGRLQFWGIIAREKKSGKRMIIYILISSLPGFIFFFLWLFALKKDSLQDASTLLLLSFSLLGILYAAQLF